MSWLAAQRLNRARTLIPVQKHQLGKEKAPGITAKGFCLVALHGFEPRTCGL